MPIPCNMLPCHYVAEVVLLICYTLRRNMVSKMKGLVVDKKLQKCRLLITKIKGRELGRQYWRQNYQI